MLFRSISASAILWALKEKFPALRPSGARGEGGEHTDNTAASTSTVARTTTTGRVDEHSHSITMVSGVITLKDQLHEYMYRGEAICEMDLLTFMFITR